MRIELEREEWDRVMAILAQAPWNVANPLLMKIGEQLRRQQDGGGTPASQLVEKDMHAAGWRKDG